MGVIFLGQAGGRVIEEVSSMLDASFEPVAGQPVSRIASGLIGAVSMVTPMIMKNMNADLQVALAVAGSHALTDAVGDGVKDAMLGLSMEGGVGAGIPPGMGMPGMQRMQGMQVINGSLVD